MSKELLVSEMSDVADIIPELSPFLAIYPSEDNWYVIHEKNLGLHIKVNKLTYTLLSKVDGIRSISVLTNILNSDFEVEITPGDIYKILYGTLAENGIVLSNKPITKRRDGYLTLKIPIIKEKYVLKISHILVILFKPRWFVYSFLTMFVFLTITYCTFLDLKNVYHVITPLNIVLFFTYSFLVTILHEIGHVTACRRFGASHGHIGFAFYLFTPVFYADVSEAWKLKSSERIIIDMAGVYMEFIIAAILAVIYFITNDLLILTISFYVILRTATNLNPLFRFDAYWAFSDYLNIPNLRKNSNKKLLQTLRWLVRKDKNPVEGRNDIFMILYGFLSTGLLIVFLLSILIFSSNSVFSFPGNLYAFLKAIITEWDITTFDSIKSQFLGLIIPLSFYIILFRAIIKNRGRWKEIFNY
jgi:putative peptide zinc metalloprotease protein